MLSSVSGFPNAVSPVLVGGQTNRIVVALSRDSSWLIVYQHAKLATDCVIKTAGVHIPIVDYPLVIPRQAT